MMKLLDKATTAIKDIAFRVKNGGRDKWEVVADEQCIRLFKNSRCVDSLKWKDMLSVAVQKADKITYSSLQLIFFRASNTPLVVDELTNGFESLVLLLNRRLPDNVQGWRTALERGGAFGRELYRLGKVFVGDDARRPNGPS